MAKRTHSIILRLPGRDAPVVVKVSSTARHAFFRAARREQYDSMSEWARVQLYCAARGDTLDEAAKRADLTLPEWVRIVLYTATNLSALGTQLARIPR